MKLEKKHAEIIYNESVKSPKEAGELTNIEILNLVKESESFDDFKVKFQKLLESKKIDFLG